MANTDAVAFGVSSGFDGAVVDVRVASVVVLILVSMTSLCATLLMQSAVLHVRRECVHIGAVLRRGFHKTHGRSCVRIRATSSGRMSGLERGPAAY